MSLDELLKGIAVFNDGLKTFAVSKGVNDANEQVRQLNDAEAAKLIEPEEALMQRNAISGELGLRLTGAGADASAIAAAREAIAPSLGAQYQAGQNKELQASSQDFTASESEKERANRIKLKEMELAANKVKLGTKFDKEQVGFLQKAQERFDKDAKNATDSLENIRLAEDSLNSNNPVADQAVINFAARASGEKGPLTETDKEPFGGSLAYAQKVKRLGERAETGKLTESDRGLLKDLVQTYKVAQYRNIMADRDKHASRAERNAKVGGYGLTKEQISETLFEVPGDVREEIARRDERAKLKGGKKQAAAAPSTPQNANVQKAATLQAWLASPEAQKNPQKKMIVEQALRKLTSRK